MYLAVSTRTSKDSRTLRVNPSSDPHRLHAFHNYKSNVLSSEKETHSHQRELIPIKPGKLWLEMRQYLKKEKHNLKFNCVTKWNEGATRNDMEVQLQCVWKL